MVSVLGETALVSIEKKNHALTKEGFPSHLLWQIRGTSPPVLSQIQLPPPSQSVPASGNAAISCMILRNRQCTPIKVARLDFFGGYLPSLSINYVAMSKDMGKKITSIAL